MSVSAILLILSFHASSLQHSVTVFAFDTMEHCKVALGQLKATDLGPFEVRAACMTVPRGPDV